MDWYGIGDLPSYSYRCGYCGRDVASARGWLAAATDNSPGHGLIYVCHRCKGPTFFEGAARAQTPGPTHGNDVRYVTDASVLALYQEARRVMSVKAFTAAVLACRKLLMHIAVAQGAQAGLKFIEYVEYFSANNFIPPGARVWVDHIRLKGNEASHEITIMSESDASDLISFSEMLLKVIYEFPGAVRAKTGAPGKVR